MIEIRQITALETHPIRQEVLRKGKPPESCQFDGDDFPTTVHLGLYHNQELAGIVTLLENSHPDFFTAKQFQLRGMAVLEQCQNGGFGALLLKAAEDFAWGQDANRIWFNARVTAVGFYEKAGYKKNGPPFEIENVGPHYLMYKDMSGL
ncbi:MAG: GNAT family N-acetyltransferase [Flavobacterium sp. BFFFF1]|uniref:GNAT family N-acetyltransferase n=1 Tax=Flavobacterium sp. BFFFF1 TaxID=2015557 RepID=UPI000BC9D508|nr:GNAT family N-acetyltransferase [Flavobacterium sp. BFFFF1]OYU80480.1 MAG: GNAT family N-acetyltransferase [Flavobacterium sp. BFFFF1]